MTPDTYARLRQDLRHDEGERARPYRDTVGKITIGVGRNLTDVGLSPDEIDLLLDNDIARAFALASSFPWFTGLDEVRQRVVINLCFNLGGRFRGFHHTTAALARRDYDAAATQLQNSKWYRQVGQRGPRLVAMLRNGTDSKETAA
jgi:lysozyme